MGRTIVFCRPPSSARHTWKPDPAAPMERVAAGVEVRILNDFLGSVRYRKDQLNALKAAGPNPTRASLMKAVLNMNDKSNPFLLPGVVTKTGPNDYFPISQQKLQKFNNGLWQPTGDLVDTRPKG